MIDPAVKGPKAALEQHHLFPRGHLAKLGVVDQKLVNQIANLAPVEWPDNIAIGAQAPADYVPPLDAKLSAEERERMYFQHALPHLWNDTFCDVDCTALCRPDTAVVSLAHALTVSAAAVRTVVAASAARLR